MFFYLNSKISGYYTFSSSVKFYKKPNNYWSFLNACKTILQYLPIITVKTNSKSTIKKQNI